MFVIRPCAVCQITPHFSPQGTGTAISALQSLQLAPKPVLQGLASQGSRNCQLHQHTIPSYANEAESVDSSTQPPPAIECSSACLAASEMQPEGTPCKAMRFHAKPNLHHSFPMVKHLLTPETACLPSLSPALHAQQLACSEMACVMLRSAAICSILLLKALF